MKQKSEYTIDATGYISNEQNIRCSSKKQNKLQRVIDLVDKLADEEIILDDRKYDAIKLIAQEWEDIFFGHTTYRG